MFQPRTSFNKAEGGLSSQLNVISCSRYAAREYLLTREHEGMGDWPTM